MALLDEVGDDLENDVFRQSVQVELHRMLRPVASPVIIQVNLNRFVLLIDTIGKELLNAEILGKGDVRTDVK